jgi:acyl-CoA dehydrogenase family protein 9
MSEQSDQIESVVGSFFYGEVDESLTFPFPSLSAEQLEIGREFCEAISRFADEKIDGEKFDEEAKIPDDVIQGLAELGMCGLIVPEEMGGMGLDYTLYARVFSEIAGRDGSTATFLGAHQSIGYRGLLLAGSEEQKKKWLPLLATGEKFAAFCLTEPGSGSDAYSIKTKAVKDGDHYIINGQKLWITNAGMADFYTVYCKTDHEVDGKTVEKISCFIVEKGMEGLSFGEKENKMGIRASETRAVFLDNVRVPAENMLGGPGKGFKLAMNTLNSGRISLGAGCIGGMNQLIKMAIDHANNRKQFDAPIIEFGMIQEKIARMSALTYALESMVYLTTENMNRGLKDYYLETAVCKVFGSEALWEVVDNCLQIAAGNGYMKEYPYERYMRDTRINLIFEGTNEILRCFIALSGIRGPSENLKELGKLTNLGHALEDPIKSLGVLSDFTKNRISKWMPTRTLTQAHEKLEDWSDEFSAMLANFSLQVENTLMKYGKNIIGNELPQRRIANMAIELYSMVAVISRTTSILNDEKASEEKKKYCLNLAELSLKRSQRAFVANSKEMTKNTDKIIKEVAAQVSKQASYGLDILD